MCLYVSATMRFSILPIFYTPCKHASRTASARSCVVLTESPRHLLDVQEKVVYLFFRLAPPEGIFQYLTCRICPLPINLEAYSRGDSKGRIGSLQNSDASRLPVGPATEACLFVAKLWTN